MNQAPRPLYQRVLTCAAVGMLLAGCDTRTRSGDAEHPAVVTTSPADTPVTESLPPITTEPSVSPEEALAQSTDPGLRQLALYGDILQSELPDSHMIFTGIPTNVEEAPSLAADMADTLKEYQRFGIEPLVIMEPVINGGETILDLHELSSGNYDATLLSYFEALKANGVTDAMMGNWIPVPEGNTPAFNITDPQVVAEAVSRSAQAQKSVFPQSKVGMLLDSKTYQSYDTEWATGEFKSLLPYTQGISSGLIDNFGLQGFPWVSEGASPDEVANLNPAEYVNSQLAIEAAHALGVRSIWFNTGTFHRIHTDSPDVVEPSAADRQRILDAVAQQVLVTQQQGYQVAVNVFAQDKSTYSEATDWSYLQSPDDAAVLARFVMQIRDAGVQISLFDAPA